MTTAKAGIAVDEGNQPLSLNAYVIHTHFIHTHFGKGHVMRYEGDKMVILFDKVGYKTLAVDLTIQQGLLKRID